MKLTLKIKLLPSKEQINILIATLKEANGACNFISETAFSKKVFNQFKLHKEAYHPVKGSFNLAAQMVIRCISKVADGYKLDKKIQRKFKPLGSIAYDSRILSYKPNNIVSVWTIQGRLNLHFVCHNVNYLPFIKGEADLVFKKGKFYLFQTVEVAEDAIKNMEEFIGCDFGQSDICTLSDGTNYNSQQLKKVRKKYTKVRVSVQSKGTKGAKKLLKRLSGRERRFVSISNHTIAKQIVAKAYAENKGIAIEDLRGIRKTAKLKSKAHKIELNKWSFYQLRQYLAYKAKLKGIPLMIVPPAYTSQTCSVCKHIGERKAKYFSCKNCGHVADADQNAAVNIATWGCIINQPERSNMFSCALHV